MELTYRTSKHRINIQGGNEMSLLIFALLFGEISLILIKWANSYSGEEQTEWSEMFTINGRKLYSNEELETMRKRVNNHKSKF